MSDGEGEPFSARLFQTVVAGRPRPNIDAPSTIEFDNTDAQAYALLAIEKPFVDVHGVAH